MPEKQAVMLTNKRIGEEKFGLKQLPCKNTVAACSRAEIGDASQAADPVPADRQTRAASPTPRAIQIPAASADTTIN